MSRGACAAACEQQRTARRQIAEPVGAGGVVGAWVVVVDVVVVVGVVGVVGVVVIGAGTVGAGSVGAGTVGAGSVGAGTVGAGGTVLGTVGVGTVVGAVGAALVVAAGGGGGGGGGSRWPQPSRRNVVASAYRIMAAMVARSGAGTVADTATPADPSTSRGRR